MIQLIKQLFQIDNQNTKTDRIDHIKDSLLKKNVSIPTNIIDDCKLFQIMKENEYYTYNHNDSQPTNTSSSLNSEWLVPFHSLDSCVQQAVINVLPVYYDKYDDLSDENMIKATEALNYLDSGRLSEVLISLCFHPRKSMIIPNLNHDLQHQIQQINQLETKNRTFIAKGMYDTINRMYLNNESLISQSFCLQDFEFACKCGHLKIAQWLYSHGIYDTNLCIVSFRDACQYGHLELAQWLLELRGIKDYYDVKALCDARKIGDYELVSQIEKLPRNIHSLNDNKAFVCACQNGHIHIVHWLVNAKINIDIHWQNDLAFMKACAFGHLRIVQWFYRIGVSVSFHDAFVNACRHGRLEVAVWLNSIGQTLDIHADNDLIFREACISGHIHVAQWIFSMGNINLDSIKDDLLALSKEDIRSWLTNLDLPNHPE